MTEIDPLLRLRDADPAREIEPSGDFVARVLAMRDAEVSDGDRADDHAEDAEGRTGADGIAGTEDVPIAPVSDLAKVRDRRRRAWFAPLAAAAAAAVVFGSGGYLAGTQLFAAETGGADSASEVASAESAAAADSAQESDGDLGSDSALESDSSLDSGAEADRYDDGDSSYATGDGAVGLSPAGVRVEFVGAELGTDNGAATGYVLDAAPVVTPEALARVAGAVGMSGEFTWADGSWSLQEAAGDGLGRSVSVSVDPYASLFYSDPAVDPWAACESVWYAEGEETRSTEEIDAEYQACVEREAAGRPSAQAAEAELRAFLTAVGLDPAQFEFSTDADSVSSALHRTAYATRVVDGSPTNLIFTLSLAQGGISSIQGPLAEVVELADYPIVSEAEAFERLTDPRFGAMSITYPADYLPEHWDDYAASGVPSAAEEGADVEWAVSTINVTSDGLGLANLWRRESATANLDQASLLLPAYRFVTEDGVTYNVLALAESALDLTTE